MKDTSNWLNITATLYDLPSYNPEVRITIMSVVSKTGNRTSDLCTSDLYTL